MTTEFVLTLIISWI